MTQEYVEGEKAKHETSEKAENRNVQWCHVFDPGFWRNSTIAIFALFVGAILLSPLTSFPGGTPKHLWYVAAGLCVLFCTAVFWITSGIVARIEGRELLTEQEVEEREQKYRKGIQDRLNELETTVSDAKSQIAGMRARTLSDGERQAIKEAIAPFAGNKLVINCHLWNFEGMRYAQEFLELFKEAGWDCEPIQNIIVPFDFDNARLGIGTGEEEPTEVHKRGIAPDAFFPLYKTLERLGIIESNGQFIWRKGVTKNAIVLEIGTHPGEHLPIPPENAQTE